MKKILGTLILLLLGCSEIATEDTKDWECVTTSISTSAHPFGGGKVLSRTTKIVKDMTEKEIRAYEKENSSESMFDKTTCICTEY